MSEVSCPDAHLQPQRRSDRAVQWLPGIFLDYGELEALTRLESQWSQPTAPPAPPAPQAHPAASAPAAPVWGAPQHGGHYGHKRQKSFGHMLFSS